MGPVEELAKKYSLSDKQIEAMGGMISFISVKQLRLFAEKGSSPDEIKKWVKRYAPKYLHASAVSINVIIENRKKLISKIQNPYEAEQIRQSLRNYCFDSMKTDENGIIQTLTPEFLHPDNSI